MEAKGILLNENGQKFAGFLLLLLSVVTGIAAIVRPMQQAIDGLQRQIDEDRINIKEARNVTSPGAAAQLAALEERFAEVETQFKWLREVHNNELADHQRRIALIENRVDERSIEAARDHAVFGERIRFLERTENP